MNILKTTKSESPSEIRDRAANGIISKVIELEDTGIEIARARARERERERERERRPATRQRSYVFPRLVYSSPALLHDLFGSIYIL